MADAILFNLASKIIEVLGTLLVQEIGLASGAKKELSKLKDSLSTINAILLDADTKGATSHRVKNWLGRLKDVVYDAEDLVDELATEALRQKMELPNNMVAKQVRRYFSSSNPLVLSSRMGHKIKDIKERLDHIRMDVVFAGFQFTNQWVDGGDINDDDRRSGTDPSVIESEVLGRDKEKDDVVNLLTSSSSSSSGGSINEVLMKVMVIPIIGIGGLGKTTFAQYVYTDQRVKTHFELRMWVSVSFEFDVDHLAKKILESLPNDDNSGGLPVGEIDSKSKLIEKTGEIDAKSKVIEKPGEIDAKTKLVQKLSGKRYLLVLDDVWNENNPGKWESLRELLVGGAWGSMILVTTRSEKVASIMQPSKSLFYHLQGLNDNVCESLFNERAFGKENNEAAANNHPKLVKIGKDIVKKCGGVPLAAKALGSLLCHTRDEKEWLDVLETEIWKLCERESEPERKILPALRISYDHLPSHLKQCFAYCSIFPEDHQIDVDDLIHQWMAHGFIQPPPPTRGGGGSHSTLEDIGNRYFTELLWRSFFQELR
ncbi:putative disease resistance protein RGA3 [Telopea speciosissima]|uniref:putative disease resistance protein RGA3 n=1 Tax=Telopea speciosissima TaxID=54955 RepID=UPI001CC5DF5C|nr:putative disease resistance protein RGA3 [Telopea speciosissima]